METRAFAHEKMRNEMAEARVALNVVVRVNDDDLGAEDASRTMGQVDSTRWML